MSFLKTMDCEKKSRQNFCRLYHETIITACNACVQYTVGQFFKKKFKIQSLYIERNCTIDHRTYIMVFLILKNSKRSRKQQNNIKVARPSNRLYQVDYALIFKKYIFAPFVHFYPTVHVQMYEMICQEINRQFVNAVGIGVLCYFLFFLFKVCNH